MSPRAIATILLRPAVTLDPAHASHRPHVSQNAKRLGGSTIDGRTTRHPGYAQSQACRPRVERVFGWLKPVAGLGKIKLRGLAHVESLFVFACAAFNVKRLLTLRAGPASHHDRRPASANS